jgi:hypothetical protein
MTLWTTVLLASGFAFASKFLGYVVPHQVLDGRVVSKVAVRRIPWPRCHPAHFAADRRRQAHGPNAARHRPGGVNGRSCRR